MKIEKKRNLFIAGCVALILLGPGNLSAATETWVGGFSANNPTVAANWGGTSPDPGNVGLINIVTNPPLLPGGGGTFNPQSLSLAVTGINFKVGDGTGVAPTLLLNGATGTGILNGGFTATFTVNNGAISFAGMAGAGTGAGSTTVYNMSNGSTYTFAATATGNTTGGLVQVNMSGAVANTFTTGAFGVTIDSLSDVSAANLSSVSLGGILTLGNALPQILSSTISGPSGAIVKQGTGTLFLTGANTFGAATNVTINAGVVNVLVDGNLGAATSTTSIAAGATLQAGGNGVALVSTRGILLTGVGNAIIDTQIYGMSVAGAIDSAGTGLTKISTGTLTLTGVNNYTGPTTVSAGTLVVGVASVGSILSSPTVANGAILTGTGTIAGTVTINSGGTIQPGNSSIGVMNTGPLVLLSGSTTSIELNPTSTSKVAVTGAATLAGTLNVTADGAPSAYASSQTYKVLTSAGLGGTTFNNLVVSTGFAGSLSYTLTDVDLTLSLLLLNTSNLSGNNAIVAGALNQFQNNPNYQTLLLSLFNLTPSQLNAALEAISPARVAFGTFASMMGTYSATGMVGSRMSDHRVLHLRQKYNGTGAFAMMQGKFNQDSLMAANDGNDKSRPYGSAKMAARDAEKTCFWMQGFGDWAHQKSQDQTPVFSFTNGGALVGYDFFGFESGMIGLAAGYFGTSLEDSGDLGSVTADSGFVGPYGTAYFDDVYVELGAFYTYSHIDTKRHIFFPTFDSIAKATHSSSQLTPHFSIGYDVGFCWGFLEPYVTLDYIADWENGFTETRGGLMNMHVERRFSSMLRSEVGVQAYEDWNLCWGIVVLREKAAYLSKAPFDTGRVTSAFVGSPNSFTVETFTSNQNLFTGSLELFVKGNNGWFGALQYDGEFGSDYISNQCVAKLGKYF